MASDASPPTPAPPAPAGPGTSARRRPDPRVAAAVAVTVAAWASAFVAVRWTGTAFSPGPLALGRLLVGAAVLAGATALRGGWVRPSGREWALLALCGTAWFGAYNVALNAAAQRVDAGTAAMLVNVGPLLLAVAAGIVLREGFPGGCWPGWRWPSPVWCSSAPPPRRTPAPIRWASCSARCRPSPTRSGSSRRSPCCAACPRCR
ncbi:DMT family transporter [Nocardiopsis trehalosi]|uniref:DMT family transporter n=1 Tax=Nocardiopsis trehalosi TaxID=109329 RepID=UPI001FDF60C8|nr:DMT family transporter [Nocardiopsis trehalosi]